MKKIFSFLLLMAVMLISGNAWAVTHLAGTVDELNTAITAAQTGDVVQLTANVDLGGTTLQINNKAITFDVNGHNLSAAAAVFKLTGGEDAAQTLVLTDMAAKKGLISGANTILLNGGYVKVDGINVKGTLLCFSENSKGNYTLQNVVADVAANATSSKVYYLNGSSKTAINNCQFTLDATNVPSKTTSSSFVSVFNMSTSGSTLAINRGQYCVVNTTSTNTPYAGVFRGTATSIISIYDGYFSVEGAATTKYLSQANASKVKIYGGTFNLNPSGWVPNGFVATQADGIYTVAEGNVAEVDGVKYDVMSEAIEAAKDPSNPNHIVKLLHSAVLSSTLTIPAGVTFESTSFTIDLSASIPLKLEAGATMPDCIANPNFVATIKDASNATYYFYALDKAVSASGSLTVKLISDITNAAAVTITSGTKTIDFNGHNVTCAADYMFTVTSGVVGGNPVEVNFINSSESESVSVLECTSDKLQSECLRVLSKGAAINVTVGPKVTIKGNYGTLVQNNATLNVYGKIVGKSVFAVCGNGSTGNGGTTINIYDGAVIESLDNTALYHPQAGTLNIQGGTITGATALAVKAGTVNISGGTLHATGDCNRQNGWSNGIEASGAAIQLESNKSYAAHVNLNITGGEFISDNCYAFYEYVAKNSEHSSTEGILFNGGKFTGNVQISQDMAYSAGGFITGGNYSHDVVAFCKENYTTIKHIKNGVWDGTYDVVVRENDDKTEIESATPVQVVMPSTTETSQVVISGDVTVSTVEQETEVQKIVLGSGADLVVKDGTTLNVGAGGIHIEDVEGSPATVTVEAGGTLTVDGLIYNSTTTNFVIESSEDKIGTLLISPQTEVIGEDHPNGTFHFTSKAKYANGKYTWQRFGVPTADGSVNVTWTNADGSASTAQTAIYEYDYVADDWSRVNYGASGVLSFSTPFTPFQCYDMTINENQPGSVYAFTGAFMGNQNAEFNLVNGWNYLANSYLAPVDLKTFLTDVKAKYDDGVSAVAYIHRSEDDKWDHVSLADFEDVFGEGPAQEKVAPMQAFILQLVSGDNVTGGIDYKNNVYDPIVNSSSAAPARANKMIASSANVAVKSGAETSAVRMVASNEFSGAFDNGYDAYLYDAADNFSIFAITEDGKFADFATGDLENVELGFATKNSGMFTLTLSHINGNFILRDLATNAIVPMVEGATYSFAANAGEEAPRFRIERTVMNPTSMDNVIDSSKQGIYTITGIYMGEDWTTVPAGVYVVNGVKMVK